MNDRKSDTPRSNAMNRAWADYMDGPMDGPGPQAPWELCGVLERELTSAHEQIARANYLIKLMAEDGWLYHGPEGMDETQQSVSDYYTDAKLGELTDKGIPVRALEEKAK